MALFRIQKNLFFEYFILTVIIASSIMIAFDNPLDDSKLKDLLVKADVGLTAIFIFEMVIKVLARGFLFCGPNSYIIDSWNKIDFTIVISSIIDLFLRGDSDFKIVKLFRLLRVIKPIRLISRNDGLKIALRTLMKSAPNLIQLMMILFVFFVLFGIFMVNVVKGQFYSCFTRNIANFKDSEVKTKWDCLDYGGVWDTRKRNFDSFLQSI